MGMASSQARLLNLTSRMHQIEYKAAKIEAEKLQMANESRRAYLEYQNAMEQTKIQRQSLGKDASIEWKDLTFADLMYGTGATPTTTGATTFGTYFGGVDGTSGSTAFMNNMVGMYSMQDGKMFVTEEMATAYEFAVENGGKDAFARKMGATANVANSAGIQLNVDDVNYDEMMAELEEKFKYRDSVIPEEPVVTQPANTNENEENVSIISRKGKNGNNNSITISAGQTGQRIKVEDDLHGTKYYDITTGNEAINITILDNGRLLIKGNGATITANEGQKDDIILMGSTNTLNTGDQDDIVRVGIVNDSKEYWYATSNGIPKYISNTINTGEGNDYVQNLGFNTINMGENENDEDYLYDEQGLLEKQKGYENIGIYARPVGVEVTNSPYMGETNYETNIDNYLKWGIQGQYGDCQTLSLINSINNQGKFNDYFYIVDIYDGNYEVIFKKYLDENNNPKIINVQPSDITDDNSDGDLDLRVIEAAFKKAIAEDLIGMGEIGSSNNYHEVGKVILGNDKGFAIGMNQTILDYLLQMYKYGEISNVVFGTSQDTDKTAETSELGIISQHAYSVKSFNENSITLVNPHDNKDSITLDWQDFNKYFKSILVFGDAADAVEAKFGVKNIDITENAYFGAPESGSGGNYEYYCQIYDEIERCGGCTTVPPEMLHNRQYLANMLNSGFAFLKEFNSKTNEWEDTSIATNTRLQEVEDESGLRKAEAKYEADMRRIDMKDRKFDYDLAALDNERNAIKQEMETLKTVAKDNVERTFKLFG